MVRSYFARYWATGGNTLIGGVTESQTSRFAAREDAEERLRQTLEINAPHCQGEVYPSNLPPEIFAHCEGSIPQAIGGKCFKCGKVLTVQDAKEHGHR